MEWIAQNWEAIVAGVGAVAAGEAPDGAGHAGEGANGRAEAQPGEAGPLLFKFLALQPLLRFGAESVSLDPIVG